MYVQYHDDDHQHHKEKKKTSERVFYEAAIIKHKHFYTQQQRYVYRETYVLALARDERVCAISFVCMSFAL